MSARAGGQIAAALLPGVLVFVLVLLDPPPVAAAPWMLRAYAPLMLWALIRRCGIDGHVLGLLRLDVPWKVAPTTKEIAVQTTLVALTALLSWAPAT